MYSRQDNVGEAHQSTFQWIHEPNDFDTSARQWDSFVQWLEEGKGIYWINGKPGSGKSTLMNYVHRDDRTINLLRVWSGAKEVFTPGFFFWNAGTHLEKSSEGLLRSLLYQILREFPSLTPPSCENQSALRPAKDGLRKFEPITAWTERRLQKAFQGVMRQAQGATRMCMFIDGLDEISGEPDVAIDVIKNMLSVDVKVCLSSRPDRSYTEAFSSCSTLRLQDLTERDIRRYVLDRLQPWLRTKSANDVSEVLSSVAWKAQGVFLWVELVVKDLIRGLKNDDTLEQLQARVRSTPSDIEALYAKMLSKIEVVYRRDAARLFRMVLKRGTHSLLDVVLALNNKFDQVSEISVQKALSFSDETEKRLPTICAGLLEVVHRKVEDSRAGWEISEFMNFDLSLPIRHACSSETAQMSILERYRCVTFIHRTALDFLHQSEQGRCFLETNSRSCPTPFSTYVRTVLSKLTLLGFPKKAASMGASFDDDVRKFALGCGSGDRGLNVDFEDIVVCSFVDGVMGYLVYDEQVTGAAHLSLCDDVERTLATVYPRYYSVCPTAQLCTPWGLNFGGLYRDAERVSWCKTSSRTSSLNSFHSATSETTFFSYRPIDFLGHAASYTLSCYVLKAIDSQQEHLGTEYIDYLLCCSMPTFSRFSPWWSYQQIKAVDLVVQLLNSGGNSNIYVEDYSNTVWGWFLHRAPYTPASARTAFAMAARTFLENGADVHMKVQNEIPIVESSQKNPESPNMYFLHVKSVLYVIRGWLEHTPELTALEEIILAKGGYDFHRFTQVAFEKDGYRPYKISERQHKKLIASLSASALHLGYEKTSGAPEYSLWAQQLATTYKQISEEDGDSDSGTSSDEDVTSDTDAEEEFHNSVGSPIATEVQDCQSIDG